MTKEETITRQIEAILLSELWETKFEKAQRIYKLLQEEAKNFLQPDVSSNEGLQKNQIKKKPEVAVCRHEWDGGMCRLCGEALPENIDWRTGERQTDC